MQKQGLLGPSEQGKKPAFIQTVMPVSLPIPSNGTDGKPSIGSHLVGPELVGPQALTSPQNQQAVGNTVPLIRGC